jgi:ATP-dependent DNA helicase RecG
MSKKIFPERESKHLEFKSIVPKFDTLLKTCVAFANASGGRIIIGVDDHSHEVIGITDKDRTKIYDDFPKSVYDAVSPCLIPQIYEKNYGKQSVLIIEIPASPRKPYFLKRQGVHNGTYLRVGSSTCKAMPEYIEDLTREAQRISYDEEIVHQNINILSKDYLHDFFDSRMTKKRLLSEHIIAEKTANKEEYAPTIAGILMFCDQPHEYIPEALVRCTRFKGIEGRDIIQTEDVTGILEYQASNSLKFVKHWITTDYALQGAKLKQNIPLPADALREAILNALLHRKYNIPGAVKIAIYDDRVEIFSPGCFPGLVDVNSLGDGTTFLRNPSLVRLAYQLNLVETRGTGIRLIYDSCKKAGIKKPTYHEDGDFVKVIFYFEPDALSYDNEADAIMALVNLQKSITAQQLAKYLSISHNTAIRKLDQLIKANQLKKIGKGPASRYTHNAFTD